MPQKKRKYRVLTLAKERGYAGLQVDLEGASIFIEPHGRPDPTDERVPKGYHLARVRVENWPEVPTLSCWHNHIVLMVPPEGK